MKFRHRAPLIGTRQSLIETVSIENPHYSRAHAGQQGNPPTIEVAVNLRESPIALMGAKGHLNGHQIAAAHLFRRLWETMAGAGTGSIDWSRVRVDGGYPSDPFTQARIDAGKRLAQARAHVGARTFKLIEQVAAEGIAVSRIGSTKRERYTLADCLRNGLDDLAELWGMSVRKKCHGGEKGA